MTARSTFLERAAQTLALLRRPRQPEAQQTPVPVEPAHPDLSARQALMPLPAIRYPREAEERRSANHGQAAAAERFVEQPRLARQPGPHGIGPRTVRECRGAYGESGPANGPRADCLPHCVGNSVACDHRSKSETCETIKLAEGPEHDNGQRGCKRRGRFFGCQIDKRFIEDDMAIARRCLRGEPRYEVEAEGAAVRIIGPYDQEMAASLRKAILQRCRRDVYDCMSRPSPADPVLVVGRSDNGDRPSGQQARQPLDKRLRAGGGNNFGRLRHGIGGTSRIQKVLQYLNGRQVGPESSIQVRQRIGVRIDSGREVEPVLALPAVVSHGCCQITAVLHGALLTAFLGVAPAVADGARLISINMCTDQLLLDLADRSQIAGLSPFARDAARSWAAEKANGLPILSGTAEEIMKLRPTGVLAGSFTKRATRDFIREHGIPIEEFEPVRTIEQSKRQITRVAAMVGAEAAGVRRIASLDAALEGLRKTAAQHPLRVLPLSRRGWVSGRDSLVSDLLSKAGLINAAGEAGVRSGGFMTLEAVVKLRPDVLLISRSDDKAEDQGRAMLLHPVLAALFPPERRIFIPEALTVCGGPMLVEAMLRLAGELDRVKLRDAPPP